MNAIVGWDIGGVNVKAACLDPAKGKARKMSLTTQPFEIWREKERLPDLLHKALAEVSPGLPPWTMALTMTAEQSDVFDTKSEGVLFVLESMKTCFPDAECYVLGLSGDFVPLGKAEKNPLDFAATNWLATAQWIAQRFPSCLIVDVGSTTTDILPIVRGKVSVRGSTDMARLSSGELIYTGVLRTNLAAIVQSVPVAGRCCRVSSEYFAVSGDVHLILGRIRPKDYACGTPDGRPPSVESARKRLARLVCADTEQLTTREIDALALYIYEQQVLQICGGIEQVISLLPNLRLQPAIILGAGAFLGAEAARRMGLKIQDLQDSCRRKELTAVPCVAAAHLLARHLEKG